MDIKTIKVDLLSCLLRNYAKAFIKMTKDAEAEGIPNLGSYITSHFRSEDNNENVGGVRGSKHLTGNAIDINMLNTGPGDEWIQKNGAKYGQFIYNGCKPWMLTHFDFDPTKVTVRLEPPKTKTPPPEPLAQKSTTRRTRTSTRI